MSAQEFMAAVLVAFLIGTCVGFVIGVLAEDAERMSRIVDGLDS